jgi:hypothetical protein
MRRKEAELAMRTLIATIARLFLPGRGLIIIEP